MIKRTNKGFTLVELIVVIVILAILATIAFITLQDYPIQARDTKRISEVGALADKVNLVTADGKTSLADLVSSGTLVTATNTAYTGSIWNINYDKINESGDAFKDPVSGKPYLIMYLEGGSGTGAVKCYEIGSFSELENTPIVKGNCNAKINVLWGTGGLMSAGAHNPALKNNIQP